MKTNLRKGLKYGVSSLALVALTVIAVQAHNKRLTTIAYYQDDANVCQQITLSASQLTTTGLTNRAEIKTQGGSAKPLFNTRTSGVCSGTNIFFKASN